MANAACLIKAEVALRADLADDVLAAKLAARLQKCDKCHYPQNADLFQEWLECYVALKRLFKIGMRSKADEPRHRAMFQSLLYAYEVKTGDHISEHESMSNLFWRMKRYRSSLDTIWPCDACMAEFQPTRKSERSLKKLLNLSLT